jgi:cobalamin biosynthesis protein CobD/CbiB
MKSKILNVLLIITSLIGYLEWSGDSSSFLFQAEAAIFPKLFSDPKSVLHPFTVIPFLGQLLLILTLFQKNPNRLLTYTGVFALGFLMVFLFVIGIISMNIKIIASTVPFLIVSVVTLIHLHRTKQPG